ncbi:MAG TPA: ABC transporter permease [Candidatus Acidoferrum sp.]|nr:ABC transporter permease [Candidatus Acidoferrum sp.]
MSETAAAKPMARVEPSEQANLLKVGGTWRLTDDLPHLDQVMPRETNHRPCRVIPEDLVEWDSSLPIFLLRVRAWCREHQVELALDELPAALKRLFRLVAESEEHGSAVREKPPEDHPFRRVARQGLSRLKSTAGFIGEGAISAARLPTHVRHFSWKDFFLEMVNAGPKALPIIGMLSFLIGVTFAFEISKELHRFGAQLWVINGVSLAILRQTGPLIAAVVLAGRTGAAFAAHIGNMKAGGEIDALEMLGISPVSFLVLPRVAALVLMVPLIALYSDLLGILGAMLVTVPTLNISVLEFWVQLQNAVSLADVNLGILKCVVFGALIALAGTLRGMQSERSALGVGRAVTSAVVTGIAATVVADAVFAPIVNHFNL